MTTMTMKNRTSTETDDILMLSVYMEVENGSFRLRDVVVVVMLVSVVLMIAIVYNIQNE